MFDHTGANSGPGANAEPPRTSEDMMTAAMGYIPLTLCESPDSLDRERTNSEHAWIVRLIRQEGPGLLRMLWRLLGCESDVMDAYQDCLCKLAGCKNRDRVRNAKAYAYRTASNIAIEMIRSRARRHAHWPAIVIERGNAAPVEARPDARDGKQFTRLREAIAELPAHLRNVITLRDLGRMPYAEVGKTLGIDPATARVYRRHAVVRLAELLGEGDES